MGGLPLPRPDLHFTSRLHAGRSAVTARLRLPPRTEQRNPTGSSLQEQLAEEPTNQEAASRGTNQSGGSLDYQKAEEPTNQEAEEPTNQEALCRSSLQRNPSIGRFSSRTRRRQQWSQAIRKQEAEVPTKRPIRKQKPEEPTNQRLSLGPETRGTNQSEALSRSRKQRNRPIRGSLSEQKAGFVCVQQQLLKDQLLAAG